MNNNKTHRPYCYYAINNLEKIEAPKCGCFSNPVEKRKQLPKDPEAKRCVLIVIEEELGVILRIENEKDNEYAVWTPYKN